MLTVAPVLGFPDLSCGFILEIDASFNVLSAVLSKKQENALVVLGYASRALKPCERNMQNYSSMKLELLALYWAVTQKYRDLLLKKGVHCLHRQQPPELFANHTKIGCNRDARGCRARSVHIHNQVPLMKKQQERRCA